MKNLLLLCFFMMALIAAQCGADGGIPQDVYGKTWLHSYEEDSADVRTYRPNTFHFPASRGRTGFMVKEDGTFIRYGIAPTDGLEEQPGTWKASGQNKIKVTFNQPTQQPQEIEVLSVEAGKLRIKQLTQEGE